MGVGRLVVERCSRVSRNQEGALLLENTTSIEMMHAVGPLYRCMIRIKMDNLRDVSQYSRGASEAQTSTRFHEAVHSVALTFERPHDRRLRVQLLHEHSARTMQARVVSLAPSIRQRFRVFRDARRLLPRCRDEEGSGPRLGSGTTDTMLRSICDVLS